ncbi:MAG: tetratricopeptide repeat protein [Isosphaeraceae bacterium]
MAVGYNSIGLMLSETGRSGEALASHERAREIFERLARDHPAVSRFQSELASSYGNIGNLLREADRPGEALVSYERAREIFERLARDHPEARDYASSLGGILNNLATIDLDARRFAEAGERLRDAIAWQKQALAACPGHPQYRQFLASHLTNLIRAARGLDDDVCASDAQRDLDRLRARDPRFEALDARLAEVLEGSEPKDKPERLTLAQRAYDTMHFAPAARLWSEALAADRSLTADRHAQHPYNAACAAVLAAGGQGIEGPSLDESAKARLRRQALGFLKQELAAWDESLRSGPPQAQPFVVQTLKRWREDADLADVRDAAALAKLPQSERKDFQALWNEVEALLRRLEAGAAGALPDNPFIP